MRKVTKKYLVPNLAHIGEAISEIGPILFPREWNENPLVKSGPCHLKKRDGKWALEKRSLVKSGKGHKLDYKYPKVGATNRPIAKRADHMWLRSYELLLDAARGETRETISLLLNGTMTPFSQIPAGKWSSSVWTILSTDHVKVDENLFARVVVSRYWLSEVIRGIAKANIEPDNDQSTGEAREESRPSTRTDTPKDDAPPVVAREGETLGSFLDQHFPGIVPGSKAAFELVKIKKRPWKRTAVRAEIKRRAEDRSAGRPRKVPDQF